MLLGKQDIYTGREDMDIAADVQLSPAAIRAYLKQLCASGYVTSKFIRADSVPCGPGCSSHNEYSLTLKGIKYIEAQIKLWSKTESFDTLFDPEILVLLPDRQEKIIKTISFLKMFHKGWKKRGIRI